MSSEVHAHYNYLMEVTDHPDLQKFIVALLIGIGLIVIGRLLANRLLIPGGETEAIVPPEKITPFGFFDFVVEAFLKFFDTILGRENRHHAPFVLSVFLFLLTTNLLSLVPGVPAGTTTVWVNVGMALVVFIYFNYYGIKEHGVWGYLKHFAGPIWWIAWFMLPLELFSTLLRILTLNLRLYWNITADHLVLEIMTTLAKIFAAPVYILGTFVSFMQAFVFTVLTMVYILLATQHGEEDHDEGHGGKAHHN